MKFKACRVTLDGTRYDVSADGSVRPITVVLEGMTDGKAEFTGGIWQTRVKGEPVSAELAARVRAEASRQRRNRHARERHDAMTSLGLKRTPYGYE